MVRASFRRRSRKVFNPNGWFSSPASGSPGQEGIRSAGLLEDLSRRQLGRHTSFPAWSVTMGKPSVVHVHACPPKAHPWPSEGHIVTGFRLRHGPTSPCGPPTTYGSSAEEASLYVAGTRYAAQRSTTLRRIKGWNSLLNFEELEETLARLDSVDAVRVVGDGTKVAEVHVVATPSKPAKQVVRDVQSLAMARYGANIDRRVISVVQLAGGNILRHKPERPVIVGIKEEPDGSRLTVRVTLSWQDVDHVGTGSGPAATSARLRLVGEATIGALESR